MNNYRKAKRKIRKIIVSRCRNTSIYYYLYKSYWKAELRSGKVVNKESEQLYFAAIPNPGAGIGHQMANWIAGYWYAKKFKLKFAHIPFSTSKWEMFLGFYKDEESFEYLKSCGYRVVRIPLFDENNINECEKIEKIIKTYTGKKVIILAEQDQFYYNQYGVINEIREKFYNCPERKNNKLIYYDNNFNLAIHIRRGDIIQKNKKVNPNLTMRFQSDDYFINALNTALSLLSDKNNIHIYLFSQGVPEEFSEFSKYNNLHLCLDMDAQESFLHMVYADALITSKSSFSYKPALLNMGIKFCPYNFWHGYPNSPDWILLNEEGRIVINK